MLLGLVLLASAVAPAGGGSVSGSEPHVGSYSLSEIHVRVSDIRVQLRCQVLSLGEVIEPFDSDLDGSLEGDELALHEEAIVDYVAAHYRLVAGASSEAESSDARRALKLKSATVAEAPLALDPLAEVSEWIDVVLDYEVSDLSGFQTLGVHFDLFYDTSPQHRDSAAVVWNGVELGAWQFAAGSEATVFEPTDEMLARNEAALTRYFRQGFERARSAFDAALLALLFVCAARARSRGSALVSVVLFLALGVAGMVAAPHADLLPQHVRFLELTVPLALAYVGLDDLLHGRGRTRVLETTVFGAVLGGREATRLAPDLAREASTNEPLVGFGLGLAAALLALAVVATLMLRAKSMPPVAQGPDDGGAAAETPAAAYASRSLRVVLDVAAIALGLWLFWGAYSAS
ncbi:MAG: hypothetical protein AAGG01_01000 [Planctomycetota bacterium]